MNILNTLLEITLYASIIAVVTLLLKKLLSRRMSPWLHYAVWFVLIVRLMLPVTFESGFHVFTAPAEVQTQTAVMPQTSAPAASADSISNDSTLTQPDPIKTGEHNISPVPPISASALPTAKPFSVNDILLTVWLSGIVVCLSYIALLFITLKRRVRRNAAEPSARLLMLFDEVKTEMNIKARLKLVCQYEYGTPALLLPRTVLMPVDMLIAMDDEQLRFALRHELTHYRRGDHVACLLISVLNAIYWFNPFVWLSFRQMRADMEMACDGAVVKALDVPQRSRYASLIVGLFAQAERRQLVLGLAQGNAKRIAEQRVRGIFKEAKSHASVKLISTVAALLLLVTCFTTACQPTPAKAVVVNKGDDTLEQIIQQTPAPTLSSVIQEPWNETLDKDGVTVEVNAQVTMPDVSTLPVVSIEPVQLTQSDVEKAASIFFGDAQPKNKTQYTKPYIEQILLELQQRLVQYETNPEPDVTQKDIDDLKNMIAQFQEQLKTAPDQVIQDGPADFSFQKDYEGTETVSLVADMGKSDNASIYVMSHPIYSYLDFVNYAQSRFQDTVVHPLKDGEKPNGMKMTLDEAKNLAQETILQMGLSDMQLFATGMVNFMSTKVLDTKNAVSDTQAFELLYVKSYDGIGSVDFRSTICYETTEEGTASINYNLVIRPEKLTIWVDDSGVIRFYWQYPSRVGEVINDNVAVLSFDDIKTVFGQQIFYNHSNTISDIKIKVDKVILTYFMQPVKDKPNEYRLIPVWDFIGDKYSENILNNDIERLEGYTNLTLNAIDGSVINRDLGY